MTEKVYSIDEIRSIVSPIAQDYGVERVFLFGSYARGEATEKSDLDFKVDMGKIDDLFELSVFNGLGVSLEQVCRYCK